MMKRYWSQWRCRTCHRCFRALARRKKLRACRGCGALSRLTSSELLEERLLGNISDSGRHRVMARHGQCPSLYEAASGTSVFPQEADELVEPLERQTSARSCLFQRGSQIGTLQLHRPILTEHLPITMRSLRNRVPWKPADDPSRILQLPLASAASPSERC